MYEDLIKRLRVTCGSCKLWDGYKCCLKGECSAQTRLQAADAIEELSKKRDGACLGCKCSKIERNEWISVTERLPEEDGKYLTVYNLNIIPQTPWMKVCRFAKNLHEVDRYAFQKKKSGFYEYDSEYGYCEVSGITHWIPLPEPPKDGE